MSTRKNWPEVLGATIEGGWVCIGRKAGRYVFAQRDLARRDLNFALARTIRWEVTPANSAILATALMAVMNQKCKASGKAVSDRGTPCPQVVTAGRKTTLYLYEAGYRDTIFPRFQWEVPLDVDAGYPGALWAAIVAEVDAPAIRAQMDHRAAASVFEATYDRPHEQERRRP